MKTITPSTFCKFKIMRHITCTKNMNTLLQENLAVETDEALQKAFTK